MVLINNSVVNADKGSANGLGQSLVALTRAVGPSFGSAVFAACLSLSLPWPLDAHIMFYFMAAASVILGFISFLMPKSINYPKPETVVIEIQNKENQAKITTINSLE